MNIDSVLKLSFNSHSMLKFNVSVSQIQLYNIVFSFIHSSENPRKVFGILMAEDNVFGICKQLS